MPDDILSTLQENLRDKYRVDREIGAGGMEWVYLAHDLRHERKVALKVLRRDLAASLGPDRFHREIRVAAALQHPHIVPLYDSGDTGGSRRSRGTSCALGNLNRLLRDHRDLCVKGFYGAFWCSESTTLVRA